MLLNSDVEEVDKDGKVTKSSSSKSNDSKKSTPTRTNIFEDIIKQDLQYKKNLSKLRNTLIEIDDLDSK